MEKLRGSDLPFNLSGGIAVVTQPLATQGKDFSSFEMTDDFCEEVVESVVERRELLHIGSLWYSHWSLCDFKSCGGTLIILPITNRPEEPSWLQDPRNKMRVACSACGMETVATGLDQPELENVLFHLLIKQMIPELKMCNFLDCSSKDWNVDIKDPIRKLGAVAILKELLYGTMKSSPFPIGGTHHYDLGFVFAPWMNTVDNSDGFGRWMRYLFKAKLERLEASMKLHKPFFIGPKMNCNYKIDRD